MEGLFGLIVLVVLAVPVLLIVALAMIGGLKSRVAGLEAQVARLQASAVGAAATEPTLDELLRARTTDARPAADATVPERSPPVSSPPGGMPIAPAPAPRPNALPITPAPSVATLPPDQPMPTPLAVAAAGVSPPGHEAPERRDPSRSPRSSSKPDPLTLAARAVRRWFSEGNVPVKVGMLVLFAGVAALLKYASDQGWMTLPVELRLAAIALAALAGLVLGWREREAKRSFGLSLQGGAVGVLLLVVFAAFKLYHFIPAGAAFALSIVLVAGAGVLAVKQNAIALALLGILAGFLAPIWLSTGQGSHVALFGYYAVLNAAIFAIAWWRPWRALNVLGFVFTFAIGTLWGVLKYRAQDFATTEPFLLLFFAFYLLIPILYAWRRAAGKRDLLDGCLVFGTPLVAFALQAGLLEGERRPLALCALGLGALYAALAWWLQRRAHFAALAAPYAILAVGFATLAVPLALSAQATASVFALEGAALAWLGLRQHSRLQQGAGALLQLGAALSFLIGLVDAAVPMQAVANPGFMGALLIALAGFASAWSYRRAGQSQPASTYYLWGLAWWLGNGVNEITRFVEASAQADLMLVLCMVTGWIAAEVHHRAPARALAWTATLALAAALPLAFAQQAAHDWPLAGTGLLAWLLAALAGWRMLLALRGDDASIAGLAHGAWLLAWPLAIGLSLHHGASQLALGEGWRFAAAALPWLATAAALQWRPHWIAAPLTQWFEAWRGWLQSLFSALLALGWLKALWLAGDSAPLPWLALLNPLDLLQVLVLAVLAAWLATARAPRELHARRLQWLAVAGFALISVITLRAAHHWGGVVWGGAMFSTSLVQTSLTVVWSVLGVLGWILGSRRGQRDLWLAGAVLMAVVLAKLVLIDRQHLGSGFGIASFLAYGLLCTAVGYFAPAPPRTASPPVDPDLEAAA